MLYKSLFFLFLVNVSGAGAASIDQFAQGLKNVGQEALNEKLFDAKLLTKFKELVAQGADVNAKKSPAQYFGRDFNGYTPLHMAAYNNKLDIVKYLVEEQGVPLEAKDDLGKTPFLVTNSCDILKYLKDRGANVNAQDNRGTTALVSSIFRHELITLSGLQRSALFATIKCLVEDCKVNINLAEERGDTPLHLAVAKSFTEAVSYLIEKGAAINIKNKKGHTPLETAMVYEKLYPASEEYAELLKANSAIKELIIKKGY